MTIPTEQRDKDLAAKLKAEWPGILQWMIDGCLKWQAEGLNPPPAVLDATAEYLQAEDSIAAWIAERCELDPNAWETSASSSLPGNHGRNSTANSREVKKSSPKSSKAGDCNQNAEEKARCRSGWHVTSSGLRRQLEDHHAKYIGDVTMAALVACFN